MSQSHNTLYFPTLPEAYPNCRLAALQHQLHVSTNTSSTTHLDPSSSSWSNLIIPCRPQIPSKNRYHHPREHEIDIVTSEEENLRITEENKPEVKKKNPYSIEELLKKPTKRPKPIQMANVNVHQPFGIILNNSDTECYRSSVNSDYMPDEDVKM